MMVLTTTWYQVLCVSCPRATLQSSRELAASADVQRSMRSLQLHKGPEAFGRRVHYRA